MDLAADEKTNNVDFFRDRYEFLLNNPMKKECYCTDPFDDDDKKDHYTFLAQVVDGYIEYKFGTTDDLNADGFSDISRFHNISTYDKNVLDWNFEDGWEKVNE